GIYMALFVWLIGLMVVFKLDFWEARVLIFINWVLNLAINLFLMGAIASWMAAGAPGLGGSGPGPAPRGQPGQPVGWDVEDIEDRGGTVQFDRDDEIVGISFRKGRVTDADLAHLSEFPRLTRLDLTNTRITDAGLRHLKACPKLRQVTLTGTLV